MQLDRFTIKSQEAVQEAQRIAREHSHQEVDGEHLLLAMIGQADSLIPDLLEKIGVPPSKLKPDLEHELAQLVQGRISSTDQPANRWATRIRDGRWSEEVSPERSDCSVI